MISTIVLEPLAPWANMAHCLGMDNATHFERTASAIASRIQPRLEALEVGESYRVRGLLLLQRCPGQDRFQVEGDNFCQDANEAAFDAVLAALEDWRD